MVSAARVLKAGCSYFALVFGAGVALPAARSVRLAVGLLALGLMLGVETLLALFALMRLRQARRPGGSGCRLP